MKNERHDLRVIEDYIKNDFVPGIEQIQKANTPRNFVKNLIRQGIISGSSEILLQFPTNSGEIIYKNGEQEVSRISNIPLELYKTLVNCLSVLACIDAAKMNYESVEGTIRVRYSGEFDVILNGCRHLPAPIIRLTIIPVTIH